MYRNYWISSINDNGERLIDLCTQTSLKIWNGFFNHKNIHKYTWEQHTKNLKSIIDYIVTNQDLKLKIQDVRAYRGPNCGTDHKLLAAKILFPCMHTTTYKQGEKKEDMETTIEMNRKYNIESLQNERSRYLYQQRLTNKLTQNEFADMEEMYNYLKKCIHEAAKEALAEKDMNKGRKTMLWDAEIEKERQKKKQLFLKWRRTKENKDKVQYKKAQAKIRRKVANNRNEVWDRKCLEIKTYLGSKRSLDSWKFIKNLHSFNSGKNQINLINADEWDK